MTEQFLHKLDKKNFFYDNIVSLAYTQFGTNEMFSKGLFIKAVKKYPDIHDRDQYFRTLGFPDDVRDQLSRTRTFTPKIYIPSFIKKDKTNAFTMNIEASAIEFLNDTKGRSGKNIELTHMTIITAWEKIIDLNLTDSAELQFFRHIRNAAAHNGRFYFSKNILNKQNGQLFKKAKWKDFEVTASMQDQALFVLTKDDHIGFWDQGDLVEFLLEFELHYPEIKMIKSVV